MMKKSYFKKFSAVAAAAVLLLQVQPTVAAEDVPGTAVEDNSQVAVQSEDVIEDTGVAVEAESTEEQPVADETVAEPAVEAEQPAEDSAAEPAADDATVAEPSADDSTAEPSADDVAAEQPADDATVTEPAADDSTATDPSTEEPAAEDPVAEEPTVTPAQEEDPTDVVVTPEDPVQDTTDQPEATPTPTAEAAQPEDITGAEVTVTPEQPEEYKTDFVYEDAEVKITARATEAAKFSQNTEMKAEKLQEGTPEYEAAKAASAAKLGTDDQAQYTFYNVYFVADGQKLDPEKGSVNIQMEFKTVQIDPEVQTQSVVHIEDTEAGTQTSDVTASSEAGSNLSSVGFEL